MQHGFDVTPASVTTGPKSFRFKKTEWSKLVHQLFCSSVLLTVDVYGKLLNRMATEIHTE